MRSLAAAKPAPSSLSTSFNSSSFLSPPLPPLSSSSRSTTTSCVSLHTTASSRPSPTSPPCSSPSPTHRLSRCWTGGRLPTAGSLTTMERLSIHQAHRAGSWRRCETSSCSWFSAVSCGRNSSTAWRVLPSILMVLPIPIALAVKEIILAAKKAKSPSTSSASFWAFSSPATASPRQNPSLLLHA